MSRICHTGPVRKLQVHRSSRVSAQATVEKTMVLYGRRDPVVRAIFIKMESHYYYSWIVWVTRMAKEDSRPTELPRFRVIESRIFSFVVAGRTFGMATVCANAHRLRWPYAVLCVSRCAEEQLQAVDPTVAPLLLDSLPLFGSKTYLHSWPLLRKTCRFHDLYPP